MRMGGLRDRRVAGEILEGLGQRMRGQEDVGRAVRDEAQVKVHLVRDGQLRNLHEERLPIGQHVRAADGQRVMPDDPRMGDGELGRAIGRRVTVIPALGEMPSRLAGDGGSEGLVEAQQNAVLAHLMADQDRRAADVAHALQTSIVGGVGLPAGDAADVQVAIARVEASML